jgi:hypothetical protein
LENAIRGEYWPENDPTMSLEDARFFSIGIFAAEIQNAYGPTNVHDPRTGEILESHRLVPQYYEFASVTGILYKTASSGSISEKNNLMMH